MYNLPGFSENHVKNYLNENRARANPHLLFYRYLYGGNSEKNKGILSEQFCPKADTAMAKHLRLRQDAALLQWEKNFPQGKVCRASFELLDRMVVGMGISSGFENGLLMDWVHGVPFINGEAVKGAARAFAEEMKDDLDEKTLGDFRKIFGTLRKDKLETSDISAGKVIFFDAYPEADRDLFDVDIITTHYGPYYTNTTPEAPGDWHSPNPVAFLAIKAGVSFRFSLASESEELAEKAMEWLQAALIRRGMGAKKRVGYGHFVPIENPDTASESNPLTKMSITSGEAGSLIMKIQNIQASKIPGSATDIVKDIEALPQQEDQVVAAKVMIGRLNNKMLSKNKKKDWMKTLKTILGEEP
ncbi:MAG: type III-B CRISPR module RAMP protein Cmr6 [Desulfococcaceae bacterium]|jgi:CRISPR-associated protein Cmr6|nr:type III-B CRISPR module RAMP protein Cmr6 [Desulfococcaceae bacterium]